MRKKEQLTGSCVKRWWILLMAMLFLLSLPITVLAQDFYVPPLPHIFYVATDGDDTTNDCESAGAPCLTIGAAIGKASYNDTVNIASGTYYENLTIEKNIHLVGAGNGVTFIDGGGSSVVVWVKSTTWLDKLTIQNGVSTSTFPGGILNQSTLSLDQVKVMDCQGDLGGAVRNDAGAIMTVVNSTFSNNSSSNSGGGINNSGNLSLDSVEITNCQSNHGGAISNSASGTITLVNSTLSGNSSTGITGSGAALHNDGGAVTIEKTTITGNAIDPASTTGAVLHNQNSGTIDLTNVTISSNTAVRIILIAAVSPVTILSSTISNNSGIIQTYSDGAIFFKNTIIYGNNGTGANCLIAGSTASLGYNLEDGNSCGLTATGDLINTDPLLLALADNGGVTQTHGLPMTSPAIDAGDNTDCPTTDQRGVSRPFDGDADGTATCDIGAFEFDQVALSGVTINGSTTGLTNSLYVFEATSLPPGASLPIAYLWTEADQTDITHDQGGITDSVSFVWSTAGLKTITIKADNGLGQVQNTFAIDISAGSQAITTVAVSGPAVGSTVTPYTFTASVSPTDATVPISYTWQTDGQPPVIHSDKGLTDTVSFSWSGDGPHTVSVTATNAVNTKSGSHIITLSSWYVNTTGDDTDDCQSAVTPCLTINGAMAKASANDTINIASGTYNEKLIINKKLNLIGAASSTTFIDGDNNGQVLLVNQGVTAFLKGLTVQHGNSTDQGGGIHNRGTLTLEQVNILNNSAPSGGGGIYNFQTGILTLRNTSLSSNDGTIGGALFNQGGQVTMTETTITGNSGGSVGDQAVVGNHENGTISMTNVTISGNVQGGALTNTAGSTVTLLNTTVAYNSDIIVNQGIINCTNTIITSNGSGAGNCSSPLTSLGHNIEESDDCGFTATGDLQNTAPLLLALRNNGGYTKTHALSKTSPALDSGDNSACPSTDQRGEIRPFDGDNDGTATCDIGAFEAGEKDLRAPWTLFLPAIIGNPQP